MVTGGSSSSLHINLLYFWPWKIPSCYNDTTRSVTRLAQSAPFVLKTFHRPFLSQTLQQRPPHKLVQKLSPLHQDFPPVRPLPPSSISDGSQTCAQVRPSVATRLGRGQARAKTTCLRIEHSRGGYGGVEKTGPIHAQPRIYSCIYACCGYGNASFCQSYKSTRLKE